jgi:hypothetical protein
MQLFFQPPVISSRLGPNIPLSTPFPNTLSLCSYINVTYQVLQPYKKTRRIILKYILNL